MALAGRKRKEIEKDDAKAQSRVYEDFYGEPTLNLNARNVKDLFYDGKLAVYVMTTEPHRACKIGISNDPGRRVRNIQTSNDCLVTIFWACRLARKEAQTLEREIHKYLRETLTHKQGEWYSVDPVTAVSSVLSMARKKGFIVSPDIDYGYLRSADAGPRQ